MRPVATRHTSVPVLSADGRAIAHVAALAAEALLAGEVVAIPTDTVYGLAAAIDRPDAIDRLYVLKGRPVEKAIPILLSDLAQLEQVAAELPEPASILADAFWPGALTLVLPALSHVSRALTSPARDGSRTVAVRVPDHELARAIIAAAGGVLAVTSANRSGEAPALDARQAASLGQGTPGLVIDGGRAPGGTPSTVVLATTAPPVVLRAGAIAGDDIFGMLAASCLDLGRADSERGNRQIPDLRPRSHVTGTSR